MEINLTSVRPPPRDWAQEYAELSSAEQDLGPEDLERYSVAAHLLGRDEQVVRLLDRAQSRYLEQGAPEKAARAVFWLIFHLRGTGQTARAAGWISRLRRMLEDHDPDDELSYLVSLGKALR